MLCLVHAYRTSLYFFMAPAAATVMYAAMWPIERAQRKRPPLLPRLKQRKEERPSWYVVFFLLLPTC